MALNQNRTPLFDAVKQHVTRNAIPLQIPGIDGIGVTIAVAIEGDGRGETIVSVGRRRNGRIHGNLDEVAGRPYSIEAILDEDHIEDGLTLHTVIAIAQDHCPFAARAGTSAGRADAHDLLGLFGA